MKFGQLIEYKVRNLLFFLKKSYRKCGGEASLRLFKKLKLCISLDQQCEML